MFIERIEQQRENIKNKIKINNVAVVVGLSLFFFSSFCPDFVVVSNGSDNRSKRSNNMVKLPVSRTDNNLRIEITERKKQMYIYEALTATTFRARSQCCLFLFVKAQNHYLIRIGRV